MSKNTVSEAEMRTMLSMNLRYLRKSRTPALSQKSLERILQLPAQTIKNYESEKSSPSAVVLFRVASYFGCTVEDLLTKKLF